MAKANRPATLTLVLALIAAALSPIARLGAHEIPSDVRVQAFLKPEGQRARFIVRAPIAAMHELEWPMRGLLLDLPKVEPVLREAALGWIGGKIDLYEGGRRLTPRIAAVRVTLPSDTSFDSYDRALAHVLAPPLPDATDLVASQALADVLFEYDIDSDRSLFSIETRFELTGLRSVTTLRVLTPDRPERAFQFHGDPRLVRLDPRWFQAAWRFVVDGFFHILGGIDHLLFLLCLVSPFRRLRALIPVVTSFTVAHSVTLIASAYDMAPGGLWFPALVETLIATSIVYMALENIVVIAPKHRWMITFAFGLIHGFGFSFALRESLQFAGDHLLTSVLSFNVGVEVGQVLVLLLVIPALDLLFRYVATERVGTIILSAIVVHTGWHWMTARGSQLLLYPFTWPVIDAAFLALAMRWLMIAVALGAIGWLVFGVVGRRSPVTAKEDSPAAQSQA